ncbi:MAG: glycosyltransferase family 25 protein [Pseudomonadota bacterium]
MLVLSQAYLLTVKNPNDEELCNLVRKLQTSEIEVEVVKGVIGGEISAKIYFEYAVDTQKRYGYLLSPGEIGCALGHMEILQKIATSDEEYALVFEDDAIVYRFVESKSYLEDFLLRKAPQFVQLGRQDHLLMGVNLQGRSYKDFQDFYQILGIDLENLFGCHGYVISKSAARKLVSSLKAKIHLIDDFVIVSSILDQNYLDFFGCVIHPENFEKSLIEGERHLKSTAELSKGRLWRRILLEISRSLLHRKKRILRNMRRAVGQTRNVYTKR